MPLYLALLISIAAHLLILLPTLDWPAPRVQHNAITVRLSIPSASEPVARDSSTALSAQSRPSLQARSQSRDALRGESLREARVALARHLLYPAEAIARGLEGETTLLLVLDGNGRVTSVTIAHSSGHAVLDQAALDAAMTMGSLPGNPRQTLLPVTFRLEQ